MKNIYVGNLSFGATEDEVRSLFEQHGAVEKVTLVRDRDSGQPRGFAFVEMPNDSEAEAAISAVNGANLGGRSLNVNEARPKTERAGGGGRGGFGGGRGGFGGGRGGRGGGGGGGRGRY
ncbi:MAG: RNA-binding protein [Acidobacteria bacterium]|nr:RNA-binding protein [Acidobacteriaceae bacterium]MBV9610747.1 RNA-binding protein [Acidobacteriota bacterium]